MFLLALLYAVFYTSLLELDIQLINFYSSTTFNIETPFAALDTSHKDWRVDFFFSFLFSNVLFTYVHPYRFCVLVSTWKFLFIHISILNSRGVVYSEKYSNPENIMISYLHETLIYWLA